MRLSLVVLFGALTFTMNALPQTAESFAADWDNSHITTKTPSDVRHADLKKYLDGLKDLGVNVNEVGRSYMNREIYQVEWGKGPLKVFMWSQMHGDEPTATSALVDMFAFLQRNSDVPWVKAMCGAVTIRAVPMLNPDGAEMYQRRGQQGIDINRDALDLKTPEARLLKQLRDAWSPEIGFNLHNQNELTTVGTAPMQAAISFLVVWGDEARTINTGHARNQRLTAAMVMALQKFIPGHISRYGDQWTPTAFGDEFGAWGTPTILIETGALHGRDEMFLVKMNYVAFMTVLQALASGSERTQDITPYLSLTENGSGSICNYIFRNATFVRAAGIGPVGTGDIAVYTERRRASFAAPSFVRSIGSLTNLRGLDEYDVHDYVMVQRLGQLAPGQLAEFALYRKDRVIDWSTPELEKQFPPDAIFSTGRWIKGEIKSLYR